MSTTSLVQPPPALYQPAGPPDPALAAHLERICALGGAAWAALLLHALDGAPGLAASANLPPALAPALASLAGQPGWAPLDQQACATYCLPLEVHDTRLGSLVVGYPAQAAGAPQIELVAALAEGLVLLLHSARLQQRIDRLTSQLGVINRLGQHIAWAQDRQALVQQITHLIHETLGHDHIQVLLINEASARIELVYASGPTGEQLMRLGFSEPIGVKSIIGWVARSGQIWVSNDVAHDPHYLHHDLLPHTVAEIALPLRVGEHVIGVLDVQSQRAHAFDTDGIFLLQTIADQVASALEHGRLFAAEHRERELATTLSDVSRIICSSLDLDQVLDLILQQIDRVVPHIGTRITLLTEGTHMRVVAAKGYANNEEATRAEFDIAQAPLAPLIMYECQTVVVRDAHTDPRWIWLPGASQVRSWCGTPLVIKDRSIGFLCVDWGEPGFYTEADARIVRAFADQAAVAIENARLYALIKSFNEQLEHKVADRTAELRQAHDEIAAKASQLSALVQRVVQVQEAERQRIARDLHDSVTQAILAAIYVLQALKRRLSGQTGEPEQQFDDCQQLLEGTLAEMKAIIYALRPRALDELGLLVALDHFASAVRAHHGLEVKFQVSGAAYHLPGEVELAIYRIVQEATQNCVRHAAASRLTISVEFRPQRLTVTIHDDGQGFDARAAADGLGLVGMRERAQALGGQLTISGRAGAGTRISLELQRPDPAKARVP